LPCTNEYACARGSKCSTNKTCQRARSAGELCRPDQIVEYPCAGDLRCHGSTNLCTPPGGAGAPCNRDGDCASYICGGDGRCRAKPQLGEPCIDAGNLSECALGLSCKVDGKCGPKGDTNAPCEDLREGVGHTDMDCRTGLVCVPQMPGSSS